MMQNLVGQTVYYNVRTKALVAVLKKDARDATVVTVKGGVATGRRRTIRASSFHDGYLASDSRPHASGYVPVDTLPGDHPQAVKKETTPVNIDMLDNLSDAELAEVILEQQKAEKAAKEIVEHAKGIAKSRRGNKVGTEVHGGIAFAYTSGMKFDGPTAQKNLSAEDFQRIVLPKADAALARALFKNQPKLLALCMKDNGPTLTVRPATNDDLERAENVKPRNEEDFHISG